MDSVSRDHKILLDHEQDDERLFSLASIRTIVGAGLGLFIGTGIMLLFTIGVFVGPIAQDTGWSRSTIAASAVPAAFLLGILAPFVGSLVDRFGPRRVLLVSGVSQAIGMVCLAFGSTNAALFGVMFVAASMLGCAQAPVPFSYIIVGWFRRRRGIAMGLTFAFAGLGIAIVPPLAAVLIGEFGWRQAYAMLGVIALAVSLPATLWLVRDPPAVEKQESGNLPGLTLREAIRTPMFWLLFIAFLINAVVATAGSISLPTVLADRGVAPTTAALAMSVVGVSLIAGRLIAGYLLDRLPPVPITIVLFLSPVIGHVLMASGVEGVGVVLAAICFGFATGAEGDAMSVILSRAFGMRSFGKILGVNFFGYAFGTGLGPFLVAFTRDWLGNYTSVFAALAVAGAVAVVAMAMLWRRRLPFA